LKVRIQNENFFRSLKPLRSSWKLMKDGVAVAGGNLDLPDIAAGQSAEIEIPTGQTPDPNSEYFLRVRHDLAEATAWHPAGMPVAWDELPLPWGKRQPPAAAPSDAPASFTDDGKAITVTARDLSAVIDRSRGVLTSIRHKDQEWLVSPLNLNFWRPPTNNDEGAKLQHTLKVWQYAGSRATAEKVTVVQEGHDVLVTAELKIPAGDSRATVRYRVTGGGQISIETDFRPAKGLPGIPRIGFQGQIPISAAVAKWYGRGPHENYVDRKSGSWTTTHELPVATMFHRYTDPQESGNRTDIRWFMLSNPMGGSALRVDATGGHLLEMGIYPCAARDITLAMHPSEIPSRDFQTLNIDHRQSGVGGSDSWGALALPKYRIPPNRAYQWSFMLSPAETPPPPQGARPSVLPRRIPTN
jgi:beta-galactosidase